MSYARSARFSHFEVNVSLTTGFNPTGWSGTAWTGAPNATVNWNGSANTRHTISAGTPIKCTTELISGTRYYIKLVAVDKLENRSAPSTEYNVVAGSVQIKDLHQEVITQFTHPPIRQTTLYCKIDTSGLPNFITDYGNLDLALDVSPTSLIVAIADNNIDYVIEKDDIAAPVWTVPANKISYLYIDRNVATEVISYNEAPTKPQYGLKFDPTKNALLHLDLDTTDEYGNTWSLGGDAVISDTQKYFGNKSLNLPGTDDYTETSDITKLRYHWSTECWFRLDSVATNQVIMGSKNQYGFRLQMLSSDQKLRVYLSSAGASFDIHNGTTVGNTAIVAETWYHVSLNFDGTNYYVLMSKTGDANSTVEITISSTTQIYQSITGIRFGADHTPANGLKGYIDEIRVTVGDFRYKASYPTPETQYTPDAHWFVIPEMKMYYGSPTVEYHKIRLFLGEVSTGESTITSIVNYIPQCLYDSGEFDIAINTLYTKTPNLGYDIDNLQIWGYIESNGQYRMINNVGRASSDSVSGDRGGDIVYWENGSIKLQINLQKIHPSFSTTNQIPNNATIGKARLFAKRIW